MTISNQKQIISHIIFWIGVTMLFIMDHNIFKHLYENLISGFGMTITKIIASYYTIYYLIPKYYTKKKYFSFLFNLIISAYLISVLSRIIMVHGIEELLRTPPFEQESLLEILTDYKAILFRYLPSNYIMVIFFGAITKIQLNLQNLSIKNEKTNTELKVLKTQLNPHFLFNTLNNIYMLSLENSSKTSKSIEKLSVILDHVLYKCDAKYVSLQSEIALIENYIELEKLRYDDRLKVFINKNINGNTNIAPLILLSLTENAFKHGASEDEGSPKIDISIEYENSRFCFIIKNTTFDMIPDKIREPIGYINITKQLELIYGNKYELNILKQDDYFTVTLILNNI